MNDQTRYPKAKGPAEYENIITQLQWTIPGREAGNGFEYFPLIVGATRIFKRKRHTRNVAHDKSRPNKSERSPSYGAQ